MDLPSSMDGQTDEEEDENVVCIPEELIRSPPDELSWRGHNQDQSQRDHQASNPWDCH